MKNSLLLIMLLVLISVVSAQEILDSPDKTATFLELEDFANEPAQAVKVFKGDMLSFEMFNQTHMIYIKELINDNIKVVFFPNKQEGESSKGAGSLPLKEGRAIALDVNLDDKQDITLHLYEMNGDNAVILIRDVRDFYEEGETQIPSGQVVGRVTEGPGDKNNYVVPALIVVGLFGVLIFWKRKHFFNEESSQEEPKVENKE